MAIAKMKHLRLIAMKSDREELMRLVQRMGCVEIDEPSLDELEGDDGTASMLLEQDDLFQKLEERSEELLGLSHPDTQKLTEAQERKKQAETALAVLGRYTPVKAGMFRQRPELTETELFTAVNTQRGREAIEAILAAEQRLTQLRADQTKLNEQKTVLAPWLSLDVPLDIQSTRETVISFGTLPSGTALADVEQALQEAGDLAVLTAAGSSREFQYFLLMYHNSAEEAVLAALKEFGWSRVTMRDWTGTARENEQKLDEQMKHLAGELNREEQFLRDQGQFQEDIYRVIDCEAVEIAREESRCRLVDTEAAFLMEGWLPAENWEAVQKELAVYPCAWEVSDPAPEEYPKVPIKLKNGPLTRCMNMITEMYSMPAYDGVDPNPLMAPFFITFFGMMMADMAYGLLMIAGALFVIIKAKPKVGTRNFMEGVLLCGISTFIFGAMTGGFLGDFIPQLLRIINPESTFEMPALFTPLDDTVAILIGSLVLGLIQVITGMLISVVKKCRDGNFADALWDEITWWVILTGIALAVLGIGNVAGKPAVFIVGCVMLIYGATRNAKGFKKLSSLIGVVYNGVTGYFSDILSYMRLMALMLAGSVIAQVFNTLGSVFGNVIVFVIISLIGNALNLALNLLGCYVHDLRLQCLEFFGRFYKEGGRPYKPLSLETKYIDIIEEEM